MEVAKAAEPKARVGQAREDGSDPAGGVAARIT